MPVHEAEHLASEGSELTRRKTLKALMLSPKRVGEISGPARPYLSQRRTHTSDCCLFPDHCLSTISPLAGEPAIAAQLS